MITCPKCFKENQDHYKFCLGCGAELPRDASPKKFAPGTPPHGVPAVKAAPAAAPAAPAAAAGDEVTKLGTGYAAVLGPPPPELGGPPIVAPPAASAAPAAPAMPAPAQAPAAAAEPAAAVVPCPQCATPNPSSNKFCASCGFKLLRPAAAAPAPIVEAPAPPAAPAAPETPPVAVLTALRADGSEAGSFSVHGPTTTIGRDTGSIFAGDSYLSPRHATFTSRSGKLFVRDEGSLNGVYRKLRRDEPTLVRHNDVFRIGQEIVRYEALQPAPPSPDGVERLGSPVKGYVGRIALVIGRETTGNSYPLPETGIHIGRERGDVLFPEDGYVSGLHCRLSVHAGQLHLTDLGSSNGSFVRLSSEAEVHEGDVLLMGQQLFRVNMA